MSSAISLDDSLALPIHRFTIEQYHRMGDLGLLTPEDRVELLEGWSFVPQRTLQYAFDDLAMDVGQAEIAACVTVS